MIVVEFKTSQVPGFDIVVWLMDNVPPAQWKNLTPACTEDTGVIFYRDEDALAFKMKFGL